MGKKLLLYSLKPPTEISCKDDRLTSKVWIRKLSGKDATPLALKTIEVLQPIKDLIHTITMEKNL